MTYQEMCKNSREAYKNNNAIETIEGGVEFVLKGFQVEVWCVEIINNFKKMCEQWGAEPIIKAKHKGLFGNVYKISLKFTISTTTERMEQFSNLVYGMIEHYVHNGTFRDKRSF